MLSLLVALVTVSVSIRVLCELYRLVTRQPFVWVTKDQWAVVTGATDGIGFEFARQLALKGYNLMLISRNEHKLSLTRQKILDDVATSDNPCPIQIETLAADFGRLDIYERIDRFLNDHRRPIFVLVNNVGTAADLPNNFLTARCGERHEQLINTNLVSMTRMCELVLPTMVRHGRGLVINVSSASSLYPSPLLDVYAATKAYMNKLNDCLAVQFASSGVTFCNLPVYVVSTNMTHHIRDRLFMPGPKDFVASALRTIKYRESFHTTGYWPHTLMAVLFAVGTAVVGEPMAAKVWRGYFGKMKHHFGGQRSQDGTPKIGKPRTLIDVLLNRH